MSDFQFIKVEKKHRHVIITLNRGRANPLNLEMLDELHICFNELLDDDNIYGVILTGKEDFFSVGVDVIEVFDYDPDMTEKFWSSLTQLMIKMVKFEHGLASVSDLYNVRTIR